MSPYLSQIKRILKSSPRSIYFDALFAAFIIFLDVQPDSKNGHYMTLVLILGVAAMTTFCLKHRSMTETKTWNTRLGLFELEPWDKPDVSKYFIESVLGMLMCLPLIVFGYPWVQFIAVVALGYCWSLTKAMYDLSKQVNPEG